MPNRSQSKMRHICVKTDGTYYEESADVKDRYAIGRSTGQLRLVPRETVFYRTPPRKFDTIEELRDAVNPDPPLVGGTRYGIYGDENPYPITVNNEFENAEAIVEEMQTIDITTALQRSEETMAKTAREEATAKFIMWASISLAGMVTIFGLVVTLLYLVPRLQS